MDRLSSAKGISGKAVKRVDTGGDDGIENVEITLFVDDRQPAATGLQIQIEIVNELDHDMCFANPFDGIQILILDSKGWPVKLPVGKPPAALLNHRGPSSNERSFKLRVVETKPNDPSISGQLEAASVELKANTTYLFEIVIDRVADQPHGDLSHSSLATKRIAPGLYSINVILPLISSDRTSDYRISESGTFNVELTP
jgi:hypothetical protein